MTANFYDSAAITNLDAQPLVPLTEGEGAPARLKQIDDFITTVAADGVGSTYRLARFPVEAKVKTVKAYIGDVDSNASATWTGDYNVSFSDSTIDGTNPNLQGLIPKSTNNGTTTTVAAYSSPNNLFGTHAASNSGAVQASVDITYGGAYLPANKQTPLWSYFGFTNNAGVAQSPGGFFDILIYVSAAAATGHAGNLGVQVDYVA